MQRVMLLLTNMRMVCNSTFLIDGETNFSPKLDELKFILLEKLDIKNNNRKIIIFSEWVKTHKLIARMLRDNDIGFVELNGKVPVKLRGELIRKFETNDSSKVFLSTEAGGVGLNLQVADTVINFELPWNPAKKNQRIGRIDRLGQKSSKLTVLNFITRNSIEVNIASGLVLKQNLFEGVLNQGNTTDMVDFSEKGRAQFLDDIRKMVEEYELKEFVDENNTEEHEEVKEYLQEANDEVVLDEHENKEAIASEKESLQTETDRKIVATAEEMEHVLNQGMALLPEYLKWQQVKISGLKIKKLK
jgi:superfamily II DNA/RNA helicase